MSDNNCCHLIEIDEVGIFSTETALPPPCVDGSDTMQSDFARHLGEFCSIHPRRDELLDRRNCLKCL